jgi:hypothetical protein
VGKVFIYEPLVSEQILFYAAGRKRICKRHK